MKEFIITHQVWGRRVTDKVYSESPERAIYDLGKRYASAIRVVDIQEIDKPPEIKVDSKENKW